MPKPAGEQCSLCEYWFDIDGATGQCKARPPVPLFQGQFYPDGRGPIIASAWPVCRADDWCGTFGKLVASMSAQESEIVSSSASATGKTT